MTEAALTRWRSLTLPSPRRSLFLCGLGASAGLLIAGFGLFTAKGTRTWDVPAENVAMVNQVPILMSDYVDLLRSTYEVSLAEATREQKRRVLDDMIREELFVQRGVELGMQSDTLEVRTALVGAVEAQASSDAIMAQPNEAELRAFYEKHVERYSQEGRMEVKEYILPLATSDERARSIRALLARGVVIPDLQPSERMDDGEEYYFAARLHLGDRLFWEVRRLENGEVSAPVRLRDGIHLILMVRNVLPVAEDYALVRPQVLNDAIDEQAKKLLSANERYLRRRADISVQKGYE